MLTLSESRCVASSWERLVAWVAPKLPRDFRSTIGADDFVQKVFVQAQSRLEAVLRADRSELDGLLRAIAVADLRDLWRRVRRRRKRHPQAEAAQPHLKNQPELEPLEALESVGFVPHDPLQAAELDGAVRQALGGVPTLTRGVLALHLAGRTRQGIAEALGLRGPAVNGHLDRGMAALRTKLAGFAPPRRRRRPIRTVSRKGTVPPRRICDLAVG